ncbi:RluA family pseudouridine synthase [Vagococcus vulneris]|uniref:Pseudouridine synthase n=1 Tax=Vagococcus vulneris TaxID=1977869 RepID=A0A430A2A8_9ENTE|nr:RluA family pseudouridine synthase [Vagococcus vulneris]RSU00570.1 pseudouridine synthase [Vagococcus vulneris]
MDQFNLKISDESGRIDKVLTSAFSQYSRSQIQSWLKDGLVDINKTPVKANHKVKNGEIITITIPEPEELTLKPQDIPIDIVYEDEDVIIVNKPQGMVVHPSAGHPDGTLVNALLFHADHLSSINDVVRPGIVHRIDKDTSGLLMVAKNDQAHEYLSDQLKEKKPLRKYLALVHGVIPHEKGTIEAPIGRSKDNRQKQAVIKDGKPALTHFKVIEKFDKFTLIECQLETGRTHQLRVHLEYIGYPIAGDPLYGPKKTLPGNGQFLHAQTIGFEHPKNHELMTFSVEIPPVFKETLAELRKKD